MLHAIVTGDHGALRWAQLRRHDVQRRRDRRDGCDQSDQPREEGLRERPELVKEGTVRGGCRGGLRAFNWHQRPPEQTRGRACHVARRRHVDILDSR